MLDEETAAVSNAQEKLVSEREKARYRARVCALMLERKLAEVLRGEVLRGMPNLNVPNDGTNEACRAVRIRGKRDQGLGIGDRPTLVLTERGQLALVWVGDVTREAVKKVFIDQAGAVLVLRAEDLPLITERVREALQLHLLRIERTAACYEQVSALAERLAEALDFRL